MNIESMVGETFHNVVAELNELRFYCDKGYYRFYHEQDCCESVTIDDIVGELSDLIGSPLLKAEESGETGNGEYDSFTWTFYKFATIKGYVDVKWFGQSNGYYSESVYCEFVPCE